MWFNPFLAQQMREERVKDALRKAEQARLMRAAKGPRKMRERHLPVALTLSSLWGLSIRPQN